MIADIDKLAESAVREFFTTMLGVELSTETDSSLSSDGSAQVVGSVSFVGQASGLVCLYMSEPLALRVTSQMLGLSQEEANDAEIVNDAIGEMTNMVGGHFKSRLTDRGMACKLSIPSIVRGSNFTIESVTDTTRVVIGFKLETEKIVVEVILKQTA